MTTVPRGKTCSACRAPCCPAIIAHIRAALRQCDATFDERDGGMQAEDTELSHRCGNASTDECYDSFLVFFRVETLPDGDEPLKWGFHNIVKVYNEPFSTTFMPPRRRQYTAVSPTLGPL
jgi:hypothetical protein